MATEGHSKCLQLALSKPRASGPGPEEVRPFHCVESVCRFSLRRGPEGFVRWELDDVSFPMRPDALSRLHVGACPEACSDEHQPVAGDTYGSSIDRTTAPQTHPSLVDFGA